MLPLPDVGGQLAAALLRGELDLLGDLRVVGDRLLRLAGERDPDRRDVDEQRHRPDRERPPGLREEVVAPVGLDDRLGHPAGPLLEEERHAVGEAEELDRLVGGPAAAVREPDLHLERVAAVDLWRARDGGDEVAVPLDLLHSFLGGNRTPRPPRVSLRRSLSRLRLRSSTRCPCARNPLLRGRVEVELLVGLRPLGLDDVEEGDEPAPHQLVADRRQAVGRRVHDPGPADRLVEPLGQLAVLGEVARPDPPLEGGSLHDLVGDGRRDAGEGALEEALDVVAPGVARHDHEGAQLDAVRVRLDLRRLLRELLGGAGEGEGLRARPHVVEGAVRVGEGGVLDVAVHVPLAGAPVGDDLQLDPRAVLLVPDVQLLVARDDRVVLARVDLDVEVVGRPPLRDARGDPDRLAGGELAVHRGGADPDPLLSATLLEPVELGAVQELPEDLGDLGLHDPRPVVLHHDDEAPLALRRLPLPLHVQREVADLDRDLGEDPGLLAGVERVVDRLLDGREEGLGGVVEAEQVPVLGEELGDGDLALLRRHLLGRRAPPPLLGARRGLLRGEQLGLRARGGGRPRGACRLRERRRGAWLLPGRGQRDQLQLRSPLPGRLRRALRPAPAPRRRRLPRAHLAHPLRYRLLALSTARDRQEESDRSD